MIQQKRTYLITGSAHRIGRGVALGLAKDAAGIVIHYNSSDAAAKELAKEIGGSGVKAFTIQADLSKTDQCESLLKRAQDLAGPIDVLINNASIFDTDTLNDLTVENLNRNMMVNAYAPFLLGRSFYKLNSSRKSQNKPVVINTIDARITDYDKQHVSYHLSKRTLFSLTKLMALEYAPGIRVNGIAPGSILPPKDKDQTYLEKLRPTNPLNSTGTIEEIVEAVKFLISAEFVTGEVIFIDGGRNILSNTYG